jgi:hypothetical protein
LVLEEGLDIEELDSLFLHHFMVDFKDQHSVVFIQMLALSDVLVSIYRLEAIVECILVSLIFKSHERHKLKSFNLVGVFLSQGLGELWHSAGSPFVD